MATIFKQEGLEYKEGPNAMDNYRMLTATPRLTSLVNSKNLIFDLRILNAGQFSFPYHFHRNAEELMMVISGTMSVRTPKGVETMKSGDLVFFEMGETGAHQFYNHSSEPCHYLDIRTMLGIDVSEYPDSGKINVIPLFEIFEKDSKVSYFKGEENVLEKWKELGLLK